MMRYQEQQKGLFTFYKEQQLFELQLEHLKNKKRETEMQKMEAEKKNAALSQTNSKKHSPEKGKTASQPALEDDDSDHAKSANTKIQQFGSSIVIVNRKQAEQKQRLSSNREHSYQEKSRQTGYFIEKKNVDFDQLEKHKHSTPLLTQKRRKTYLKKMEYKPEQREFKQRRSTKLPTLMKVEESNLEEDQQIPHRARVAGSSLRYNCGDLMKYIRNNLHSECEAKHVPEKSVSFIEFSKGYIKQSPPKKLEGLNEEQKRLLDILYRYRKPEK